ncbi:methyltransferase domain-containing protein [candidate division KSB1 bacterium]|nr:methyltransferase domain-containing protein [candidate division KSB1 bacterium]
MMQDEIIRWETNGGVEFIKKTGIQAGHRVIDFGTRVGHYSIPAAIVVGQSGYVYAIDKEKRDLDVLEVKKKKLDLHNLEIRHIDGNPILDFINKTIDVVMCYDVLHLLRKEDRIALYGEISRVLKPSGFFSVFPKHVIEDNPVEYFTHMHLEDVKQEIQSLKFKLANKICDTMIHDDRFAYDCVFVYGKTEYDCHQVFTM